MYSLYQTKIWQITGANEDSIMHISDVEGFIDHFIIWPLKTKSCIYNTCGIFKVNIVLWETLEMQYIGKTSYI